MSGEDDDEALTWAGGRDPSYYETPEPKVLKPAKPAKTPEAARPADTGAESVQADDEADDDDEAELPPTMSGVVLVCLGVLGGIYALYTVGWFVSWQRMLYSDPDALELAAFHIQQVLAILAAPLWFVATLLLTRNRKPATRLLWLVIGALVLVPWSFTFGQ